MRTHKPKDPVEALLSEREPYLDNGDFAKRVLGALPGHSRRLSWRAKRRWVKGISLVVGLAIGLALLGPENVEMLVGRLLENSLWLGLALTGFFLGIAASCLWALSDEA